MAATFEVCLARVDGVFQAADAAADDVLLVRRTDAERDVGLAHRQAEVTHVGDELDEDAGELRVQAREARGDEVARDALRAGDSHDAAELLVTVADAAPEAERLRLQDLGLAAHLLARERQHVTFGGAVQQPDPEFRL